MRSRKAREHLLVLLQQCVMLVANGAPLIHELLLFHKPLIVFLLQLNAISVALFLCFSHFLEEVFELSAVFSPRLLFGLQLLHE